MIDPVIFLSAGLTAAGLYAAIYFVGTYITRRNKDIIMAGNSTEKWSYDQSDIRRRDRLLPEDKAMTLLSTGEFGYLSMITADGEPYGVPLNYVFDGLNSIYIHCAPEGKKLRAIHNNSGTSFCIVGATHVISNKFTTAYESIILKCHAHTSLTDDEKRHALELLLDKYCQKDKETGLQMAEKSFARTEIIRLDIVSMSGKCKVAVE